MIARSFLFFDKPCAAACDARCDKAWGIQNRPKIAMSDNDDDYAYLADGELGAAPADPGTYEGDCAKPDRPEDRLNKWCIRECERSVRIGRHQADVALPDFSSRFFNQPWKHPATPAQSSAEQSPARTITEGDRDGR